MLATQKEFIIALDEGTTNAKAVVLDGRGNVIVKFSQPLAIQTPRDGWVEQSGEALVEASLAVIANAIDHVGAENVAALAISNQRETAIGWYRQSGKPITPPSPGNVPAARGSVKRCAAIAKNPGLNPPPDCRLPRCFPPQKCAGCWSRCRKAGRWLNAVRFASVPSIAGCCGT